MAGPRRGVRVPCGRGRAVWGSARRSRRRRAGSSRASLLASQTTRPPLGSVSIPTPGPPEALPWPVLRLALAGAAPGRLSRFHQGGEISGRLALMRLSVILPTHNEAKNILGLVSEIKTHVIDAMDIRDPRRERQQPGWHLCGGPVRRA